MDLTRALRECRTPYEAMLKYTSYLGGAFPDRAQLIVSTKHLPAGQFRVWRLRTDDGAEHVAPCDPWRDFDRPVHQGGVIGRITQNLQPQLIHDMDLDDDPCFARELSPYHSLIAVPLFNERLTLNWSLMLARDSRRFSAVDLEESITRATLIGSLLDSRYVSKELSEAHAYIDRELERMARIQRTLLPEPIPRMPGLQLAASYETFIQVGGDLYDFIPLDGQSGRCPCSSATHPATARPPPSPRPWCRRRSTPAPPGPPAPRTCCRRSTGTCATSRSKTPSSRRFSPSTTRRRAA